MSSIGTSFNPVIWVRLARHSVAAYTAATAASSGRTPSFPHVWKYTFLGGARLISLSNLANEGSLSAILQSEQGDFVQSPQANSFSKSAFGNDSGLGGLLMGSPKTLSFPCTKINCHSNMAMWSKYRICLADSLGCVLKCFNGKWSDNTKNFLSCKYCRQCCVASIIA